MGEGIIESNSEVEEMYYCSCPHDENCDDKEEDISVPVFDDEFENGSFDEGQEESHRTVSVDKDLPYNYKDLLNEIWKLREENNGLQTSLVKQEQTVKILQNTLKRDKKDLIGGVSPGNTALRIFEFTWGIQQLVTDLQKANNKYKGKSEKLKLGMESFDYKKEEKEKDEVTSADEECKTLVSSKYLDELESVKKELKAAHMILLKEVGEVSFEALQADSDGWKGRQEQILALKSQVVQLQEDLEDINNKKKKGIDEIIALNEQLMTTQHQLTESTNEVITLKKHLNEARKQLIGNKEKSLVKSTGDQKEIEMLRKELEITDAELKIVKEKLTEFLVKVGEDGKEIEGLNKELSRSNKDLLNVKEELSQTSAKYNEEIKILQKELNQAKKKLTDSKEKSLVRSTEANKEIDMLKKELKASNTELKSTKEELTQSLVKLTANKQALEALKQKLLSVTEEHSQSAAKSTEEIEKLQKELELINKVLSQEIGKNSSFQALFNSSDWRGRLQQILNLQQRVTDLQSEVSEYTKKNELQKVELRKMEIESKEQQETLNKKLEAAVNEMKTHKEKQDASRARNKALKQEVKVLKQKLAVVLDKEKHDEELVSALLKEQKHFRDSKAAQTEIATKLQEEVKKLQSEVQNLQKDKQNNFPDLTFVPKPPSPTTKKIDIRRRPVSGSPSQQPASDLQYREIKLLLEALSVEKDRLTELVQVLQRRNEELVHESLQKDFTLTESRNEKLKLERRLEKLTIFQSTFDSGDFVRGEHYPGKLGERKEVKSLKELEEQLLDSQTKLSIEIENKNSLQEALAEALQAKEEDLKVFQEMMDQAKKLFLQGIRQK